MQWSGLPASVFIYIFSAILPAILAFVVLAVVARTRSSSLWLVPGLLAAAAIAPVLAAFFGVRQVIAAFGALAMSGGGIGAVSAGLWEAMQPSLVAGYVACALTLITAIIAIRGVINAETPESRSTSSTVTAMAVLLVAIAAVAISTSLYLNLNSTVIDVIDPHGPPMAGIAATSQMIANHLTRAAFVAAGFVMLLIVCVVITAVMDPKAQPSQGLGIFLTFASVLCIVGMVVNLVSIASWCSRLEQTALTGQVVR